MRSVSTGQNLGGRAAGPNALRRASVWGTAIVGVLGLLTAGAAAAQHASLTGKVALADGTAVAGADVLVTDRSTGFRRQTTADREGGYRFLRLPPGSYHASAELRGYVTQLYKYVKVEEGAERRLDFELEPAEYAEIVTLDDLPPGVRTEGGDGLALGGAALDALPADGRELTNLVTLANGAGRGPGTFADPDRPTVSFGAGPEGETVYVLDGVPVVDRIFGGALLDVSTDALGAVTVHGDPDASEYGGALGGVVSMVTASGANSVAGTAAAFLRDDGLGARPESARRSGASPELRREHLLASVGGPAPKNAVHYFLAVEDVGEDADGVVQTGGILPESDGGSNRLAADETLVAAKLTANLSRSQHLTLRYGRQQSSSRVDGDPPATPVHRTDLEAPGTAERDGSSILLGLGTQVGATAFHGLRLHVAGGERRRIGSSGGEAVSLFPNGTRLGAGTPSWRSRQRTRRGQGVVALTRDLGGRPHDVELGLSFTDEPVLDLRLDAGPTVFRRSEDRRDSPVTAIAGYGGSGSASAAGRRWSAHLQDSWRVGGAWTLGFGARYDRVDRPRLDQTSNAAWRILADAAGDDFAGEPVDLEDLRGAGVLDGDRGDLSIRASAVWAGGGHFVRAAAGRFHSSPPSIGSSVLAPALAAGGDVGLLYWNVDPGGIRNPDGSLFQPGDPLPPSLLPSTAVPVPTDVASSLDTPSSDRLSVGWSWQMDPFFGVAVDATRIEHRDLPAAVDLAPLGSVPELGEVRLWSADGEARYDGVSVSARGRLGGSFDARAAYTWSQSEGAALGSVGPLIGDAKHRITVSGVYWAPKGLSLSAVFRYRSALPYGVDVEAGPGAGLLPFGLPTVGVVGDARGASSSQLDLRVSKRLGLREGLDLELIAEVWNVFDDDNPSGFVGDTGSTSFGQPTRFAGDPGEGPARIGQLGVRFRF
ncbi:MAG: TonB-dependent receptor [Acidobacteriota bacterium]